MQFVMVMMLHGYTKLMMMMMMITILMNNAARQRTSQLLMYDFCRLIFAAACLTRTQLLLTWPHNVAKLISQSCHVFSFIGQTFASGGGSVSI